MKKKIAIIGAGNGGFAMAVDLGLAGFDINLFEFPEYNENIATIRQGSPIQLTGAAREGSFSPSVVTDDVTEAVDGATAILVVTQATAHKRLIELLGPCLQPRQCIYLFASYASSITMSSVLEKKYNQKDVRIAEVMTLPYACRKTGPDSVNVLRRTGVLGFVAFPGKYTQEMYPLFNEMYPSNYLADNVIQQGLSNQNVILHPTITLMNAGWIESEKSKFNFYGDGCSPSVELVFDKLDKEALAVFEALKFPTESPNLLCERRFELPWKELQAIRKSWPIVCESVNTRYITEDVPTGLVLMSSLGKYAGVPTPTYDALIQLSNVVLNRNFWAEGRTMETMGIAHIPPEKLHSFLQLGECKKLPPRG